MKEKVLIAKVMLPGFEGKYEVSSDGKVFMGGKPVPIHGNSNNKETFVRLFKGGKSISITVARLMMMTFYPVKGMAERIVIHKKGKKNVLSNLKWGTREEQSEIAMKKEENFKRVQAMGKLQGPKLPFHPNARRKKMDTEKIKQMNELFKQGVSRLEIASQLGVSRSVTYVYIK